MRIALVSCSKLKADYPCKARELYGKSTLFSKATTYIESQGYDKWFILSAKYGLVAPSDRLEPYDQTLHDMRLPAVQEWSNEVFAALMEHKPDTVDIYAGERYRRYLVPILQAMGFTVNVPLEGKEIGQQLQFYTEASRAALPLQE
jgi:hypothetical protein